MMSDTIKINRNYIKVTVTKKRCCINILNICHPSFRWDDKVSMELCNKTIKREHPLSTALFLLGLALVTLRIGFIGVLIIDDESRHKSKTKSQKS